MASNVNISNIQKVQEEGNFHLFIFEIHNLAAYMMEHYCCIVSKLCNYFHIFINKYIYIYM